MHSSIQFRHEAISTYCWRRLRSLWLFRSNTLLADSDMYWFFFMGRNLQVESGRWTLGSSLISGLDCVSFVVSLLEWSVSSNWCHKLSVTAGKQGHRLRRGWNDLDLFDLERGGKRCQRYTKSFIWKCHCCCFIYKTLLTTESWGHEAMNALVDQYKSIRE